MISKRALSVDASGIRKVFDLAASLKNPVNLSIGQPDFDVPEKYREQAVSAIKAGKNKYTVTQGIEPLREEVRSRLKQRGVDVEEVFITSGVSGGILLSLMALTDPGDEVLVPDPYFVMYKHLANLLNLKIKYIDTYPDFQLTAERVEKALTEKTRVIVMNSPSNPTGIVMGDDELKKISEVLKKASPVVIYDEIYSDFDYEKKHGCMSRFYEKTVLLSGFSKSHAMTGWRIGFAAGPKSIIEQMIKLQQYTYVCCPSIVQYGALGAVSDFDPRVFQDYRKKRDLVFGLLEKTFHIQKPQGAFYVFPESPSGDGEAFVRKAIENNVLIIPGNVFSERNTHFRISFAAAEEVIVKGCEILNRLA